MKVKMGARHQNIEAEQKMNQEKIIFKKRKTETPNFLQK